MTWFRKQRPAARSAPRDERDAALDAALERELDAMLEEDPGEDDGADADEPLDPQQEADVQLITDYLADELTPDARAGVEERLRTDHAFRAFVDPILVAWNTPSWAERHRTDPDELRRSWKEIEAAAGSSVVAPPRELGAPPATIRRRRLTIAGLAAAAVIAIFASGIPQAVYSNIVNFGHVPTGTTLSAPDGMVITAALPGPIRTRVELRSGSTLTYPLWLPGMPIHTMRVSGEAEITVPAIPGDSASDSTTVTVNVGHARVVARAGAGSARLIVHGYPGEPVTLVSVAAGRVELWSTGFPARRLVLTAGEHARVGVSGAPEKIATFP